MTPGAIFVFGVMFLGAFVYGLWLLAGLSS